MSWWWLSGALFVASLAFLAWVVANTAAHLAPLQRVQRRLNTALASAQSSLEPRLAEIQREVAQLQQEAEDMRPPRGGGKHRG